MIRNLLVSRHLGRHSSICHSVLTEGFSRNMVDCRALAAEFGRTSRSTLDWHDASEIQSPSPFPGSAAGASHTAALPDRDCVRRTSRSALAWHDASEILSSSPFPRAAAGASHTAALLHSRNTPNSSRNLALLQAQSLGSSTSFALAGLLS